MMSRNTSQTVEHALVIVEAFQRHDELGVSDLAKKLALPKTVVHRILATLERRHYVGRTRHTRKYCLTLKLWEIGSAAINRLEFPAASKDVLERLVAETGQTAYLSVLDIRDVVYVAKVEGNEPLRVYVDVGGRVPACYTATGRAQLANVSAGIVDHALRRALPRLTRATITDPRLFRRMLADVRATGVALNLGERREDIGAVAAPIFDREDRCVAAVGVSGPISRFPEDRLPRLIRQVKRAATDISARLGHLARAVPRARLSG